MKKRISEIIIVEGKYDKNVLSQAVDATIIETAGFQIFSDSKKVRLIRRLAEKCGIIIMTDSDSAGFLIRNHLRGMLDDVEIKNAYIPEIRGRERRKRANSKEGLLGVEGMNQQTIIDALILAGATFESNGEPMHQLNLEPITKTDMYIAGLSGCPESTEKRKKLKIALGLPSHLSSNNLLDILNSLYTRDEFLKIIDDLFLND